jgi:hypothetical protein
VRLRARTVATAIGRRFENVPLAPRIGLKADVTSGDADPSDRKLGTFNPLYPNLTHFNDAAFLAPQNHRDLSPSLGLALTPQLGLSAGVSWFWKTRRADAIYRAPGIPVGGATRSCFLARQLTAALDRKLAPTPDIRLSFAGLQAGSALRNALHRPALLTRR